MSVTDFDAPTNTEDKAKAREQRRLIAKAARATGHVTPLRVRHINRAVTVHDISDLDAAANVAGNGFPVKAAR